MIQKLKNYIIPKTHQSGFRISDSKVGTSYIFAAQQHAWREASETARHCWIVFLLCGLIGSTTLYFLDLKAYGFDVFQIVFALIGILFLNTKNAIEILSRHNFSGWLVFALVAIFGQLSSINLSLYKSGEISLTAGTGLILFSIIGSIVNPGPGIYIKILAVFAVTGSLFVTRHSKFQVPFSLLVLTTVISGLIWKHIFLSIVNTSARSSLAMRITKAPANTAASQMDSNEDLDRFAISSRKTAIIVVKWSNFANVSHDLRPSDLDKLLKIYFAAVDKLLMVNIPSGAWFADVIQHEVHIYIFEEPTDEHPAVLAFKFAKDLLKEKNNSGQFSSMGHLDIGLAYGSTTSGILGPKAFKKTAAIGTLSQEAISSKALGGSIRQAFGGSDKIIFDFEVAKHLEDQSGILSLTHKDLNPQSSIPEKLVYVFDFDSMKESKS